MAALDHDAIRKAYPLIETLDDSFVDYGLDKDDNKISIEQSKVDAARTTLDTEAAAMAYQSVRKPLYPSLGDFADAMYWNSKGDSSKLTAYYAACEKVKTDNPKPN
jgi:hypothetical protein|tara:strand:+ start:144 stop:461 length:318 start_codon:yes stop_codon:yes gene_type:complete